MHLSRIIDFYRKNTFSLFFVLTCLFCFVPLVWFDGRPIAGEEFYALNYAKWGRNFAQAWTSSINFGEGSMLIPFKMQFLFFETLNILGVSSYISLISWHIILWLISLAGIYLLQYKIFKKKLPAHIYFIISIYYTFSPFFLNISPLMIPPRMVFSMVPWIVLCFFLYHEKSIGLNFFAFLLNVLLLFFSPVFVNLPAGASVLLFILIFIVFEEILVTRNILSFIKSVAVIFGLFALFNAWWLIPTAIQTSSNLGAVRETTSDFSAVGGSHLSDIFSLFGSWAFREKIYGTDLYYFDYFKKFDNLPGIFFRFTPFVFFVFGALYLIKQKSIENHTFLAFFTFIGFIFLFLAKGTSGVGGSLFLILFKYVPFFWIFREPYSKFMPIVTLSYSIIIVVGLLYISKISKKWFVIVSEILLSVSVLFILFPYVTSAVIWTKNTNYSRSYKIDIPENYKNLEAIDNKGYFLQFPSSGFKSYYEWSSGYVGNPFLMLSNLDLLNPESGYSPNIAIKRIVEYLYIQMITNPQKFQSEASRYNVGGVILQKDTLGKGYDTYFDKIATDYINTKQIENENYNIYKVAEPEVVEVIQDPKIYSLNYESLKYYSYLKNSIIDNSSYLSIGDFNDPDIYNVTLKFNPNDLSATGDVHGSGYIYKLYDPENIVSSLKVDDELYEGLSQINTPYIYSYFSKKSECCSKIKLDLVTLKPEISEIPLNWIKTQNADLQKGNASKTPELSFEDKSTSYMLPLGDLNINSNYIFELNQKSNINTQLVISLAEVDNRRGSVNLLLSKAFNTADSKVDLTFSNIPPTYYKVSNDINYYLILAYPSNFDINPLLKININAINKIKIYMPFITAVKNIEAKSKKIGIDQTKISDSAYIIKVPPSGQKLIHFKQSYNKGWKLVPISEEQYFSKNLFVPKIKAIFSNNLPLNIEVYSNGWNLDTSSAQTYYALIFAWDFFANEIFLLTLFTIILIALIISLKKLWRF
jgi:hypothetical protein